MGLFGGDSYADDGPFTPTRHNLTCSRFAEAAQAARPTATVRADHCAWPERPTPRNGYVPDFELIEGNYRLVGEVETAKSLTEKRSHAYDQLQGFTQRGIRRLLIMPDEEKAAGVAWITEVDLSRVLVLTPGEAPRFIREPSVFDRLWDRLPL